MSTPPPPSAPYVPVRLVRVVLREKAEQQWLFLEEDSGSSGTSESHDDSGRRGFPIVIGTGEAYEIHRILTDVSTVRPMTHQLAISLVRSLGSELLGVDIVDLRSNTFYAQIRLSATGDATGADEVLVDARPSDALALALRAGVPIRVAESVLEQARTDAATDELTGDENDETLDVIEEQSEDEDTGEGSDIGDPPDDPSDP